MSGALNGTICLRDGDGYRYLATSGLQGEFGKFLLEHPPTPGRGSAAGRVLLSGMVQSIPDVLEDADYVVPAFGLNNTRSVLGVPLLRDDKVEGALVLARGEAGMFTERQIELVQTFADQAVIAIENVRLFDEVQARTAELSNSLQQQTATADVLKVISRSTFDLQAVFDTLVTSATQLCGADAGVIWLRKNDLFYCSAAAGHTPERIAFFRDNPRSIHDKSLAPRVLRSRQTEHIPDVSLDPEFAFPGISDLPASMLGVPLLRNDVVEGVFTVLRVKLAPFTPRQIELVESFADQAVIAIENVRLFDEVQARTEDLRESLQQQTATADVLKVISRSALELQPVLETLVKSAARLCEAEKGVIFKREGDLYHWSANFGNSPELEAFAKAHPFTLGRHAVTARVALEGKTIHVTDVLADPEYDASQHQKLGSYRTILGVPLLREGTPIGVFALTRADVRPFTPRQIELVQTFADQAVIAIENARLFNEVQARTKELAASLENLRSAQDRLVQTEKLASLGQLTAGIAHEIKNPLNFVNNFAALSAELTDELNDVLKPAALADKMRGEIDELTGLLKDNLQKVVQHGRRANSIVKNMLLHSREGSGEHRPADINALLDESLNLAYHGARAERPDFNVTLQRDFDESAGLVELFPQEITRAFLNLISNGFYATAKRKTEAASPGFEPMLQATTKNIGNGVEIRIRDNGTGIAAEVKEKMFNPFFTTKPAGEGTGLGLSMSHDIIVKQHGGTIDVETQPGEFTEFKIVLPRTSHVLEKKRDQT